MTTSHIFLHTLDTVDDVEDDTTESLRFRRVIVDGLDSRRHYIRNGGSVGLPACSHARQPAFHFSASGCQGAFQGFAGCRGLSRFPLTRDNLIVELHAVAEHDVVIELGGFVCLMMLPIVDADAFQESRLVLIVDFRSGTVNPLLQSILWSPDLSADHAVDLVHEPFLRREVVVILIITELVQDVILDGLDDVLVVGCLRRLNRCNR